MSEDTSANQKPEEKEERVNGNSGAALELTVGEVESILNMTLGYKVNKTPSDSSAPQTRAILVPSDIYLLLLQEIKSQ